MRDPTRRRPPAARDNTEVPSPVRRLGEAPATPPLVEVQTVPFRAAGELTRYSMKIRNVVLFLADQWRGDTLRAAGHP